MGSGESRSDLVGIVGEIVDDRDVMRGADNFEADARRPENPASDCAASSSDTPQNACSCQSGQRILHIVAPRHAQFDRGARIAILLAHLKRNPFRPRFQIHAEHLRRRICRLNDTSLSCGRRAASRADSSLSRLKIAMRDFATKSGEQNAQLVQRFVVERDIGHDRRTRLIKRDGTVALIYFADEAVPRPTTALAKGTDDVMKFFITAPFMTVGRRPTDSRIQPIIPVVVDFPLVPATPTAIGAALNSCASNSARLTIGAPMRRAATTSGTLSSTAAEITTI